MSEIPKLSNVEYTLTDEVINRKWSAVYAFRNKLLSMSDWTQLGDSNIPQNIKNFWKTWRQKIRNIKKALVNDPDKALELLKTLENQMPEKIINNEELRLSSEPMDSTQILQLAEFEKQFMQKVVDTICPKITSMDDIDVLIKNKFEDSFSKKINIIIKDELLPIISNINQQIKQITDDKLNYDLLTEAIDYLHDNTVKCPLLKIYADNTDKSLLEMAEHLIKQRKQQYINHCNTVSENFKKNKNE